MIGAPMQRREFITLLGGATAAWPLAARAQQPTVIKRIGWLGTSGEDDPGGRGIVVLVQELQKVGWVVDRNLQFDSRFGGDDDGRLRVYAADIVGKNPNVIVTTGTQASAIVQQLTHTIPIVFVNVADPVASGFVASFARPGGNMTGFISVEYSLAGKWLSVLKDTAPSITRVTLLYNPDNTNWTGYVPVIKAAAASMRMEVSTISVSSIEDIQRTFEMSGGEANAGMIVAPSGLMINNREKIATLAARYRVPVIYPFSVFAVSGGLVSYGPDDLDQHRQSATYVDRILKGEKPADLPVQAPVKFELVINLKAAKALGLDVPYNLLILADRVID
jgi:ABC-type uncharacterized transport system substrate-binding protein